MLLAESHVSKSARLGWVLPCRWYTSRRLKTFNARMKLRSSMIAVTLITSARLSVSKKFASDRSLDSGSQRNVESAPKKLPSFLDIPEENDDA